MTYLLAFHIGPIQDFIATARRTQDWWMGSWLLAHLSRHAIETAQTKGATLVLPIGLADTSDPAIADTPNHFLARISGDSPETVAKRIEDIVRTKWGEIDKAVKNVFFSSVSEDLWNRQVDKLLEIYWAIVPEDGSDLGRNHAQAALDARKRLRNFEQTVEENLKCTLCGSRQELSGKTFVGTEKTDGARKWWIDLVQRFSTRPHLQKLRIRENGNEQLCAVCAVKRAAVPSETALPTLKKTDASFPSTSTVASVKFLKRILDTGKATNELEAHFRQLKDIGIAQKVEIDCLPSLDAVKQYLPDQIVDYQLMFDGDVFYLETFTEKRIGDEYPEADGTKAEQAAITLQALYHAAEERPSKYFAALMMDGDHMGAFYSKMGEKEAQSMSLQMSEFARFDAKSVLNAHFGRLVYAGGDDVLALLPLEEALECARELQIKFNEKVQTALQQISLPNDLERPTPSIGIAIAHHTQPLDAILQAMQQAEKAAKNRYGRDALCVYVLKRSGEEVHVGTHWQDGEDKIDGVKIVTDLVDLLKQKGLSMKFSTVFADEARFLPIAAIEAELRRVGKRQSGEQFEQHAQKKVDEWLGQAAKLAAAIGAEEFAQWTLLARFIASGGRDEE